MAGADLAKVRVRVMVNPVTPEAISLSRADYALLTRCSRAWGLAAARGDAKVERLLHELRRNGPPYVDPALPEGVALYYELE